MNVIAESLIVNSQYKPVVVNRGTLTGRPDEVLAGNHTLLAVRELAAATAGDRRWKHIPDTLILHPPGDPVWQEILVHEIDVDDDQAARINAIDNRATDLGGYDDTMLSQVLSELPDLTGTGYTGNDLDELLRTTGAMAEEASGFLQQFIDPAPAPAPVTPTAPDTTVPVPAPGSGVTMPSTPIPGAAELVAIHWVVTVPQRDTIRAALKSATQLENLDNAPAALTAIADHYLTTTTLPAVT